MFERDEEKGSNVMISVGAGSLLTSQCDISSFLLKDERKMKGHAAALGTENRAVQGSARWIETEEAWERVFVGESAETPSSRGAWEKVG
jgi:hypothetical protein